MTRHAGRRQLRLVQLDQVLHLPALAVDILIKILRRTFERGDDVADIHLLAHAGRCGLSGIRLQRTLQPRCIIRVRVTKVSESPRPSNSWRAIRSRSSIAAESFAANRREVSCSC